MDLKFCLFKQTWNQKNKIKVGKWLKLIMIFEEHPIVCYPIGLTTVETGFYHTSLLMISTIRSAPKCNIFFICSEKLFQFRLIFRNSLVTDDVSEWEYDHITSEINALQPHTFQLKNDQNATVEYNCYNCKFDGKLTIKIAPSDQCA